MVSGSKFSDGYIDEIEVTSRLINMILDMPLVQQIDLLNKLDAKGFAGTRNQPRTSIKHPWLVTVDPEKKNSVFSYYIQNISRCGMFIETQRRFEVGEKVMLTFQIPSSKKTYKVIGEVARSQRNGIGVKFKRQLSSSGQ